VSSNARAFETPDSPVPGQPAVSLLRLLTDNREPTSERANKPRRIAPSDPVPPVYAPPPPAPEPTVDGRVPEYAGEPEVLAWLDRLVKGKPDEQARARTEIGLILEARGYQDDAEEAYWTNVQSRSTDRRAYDRLIALYQERQDRLSETLVQRQLDAVFNAPTPGEHGGASSLAGRPLAASAGLEPDEADSPAYPWTSEPTRSDPPVRRLRRRRSDRQAGAADWHAPARPPAADLSPPALPARRPVPRVQALPIEQAQAIQNRAIEPAQTRALPASQPGGNRRAFQTAASASPLQAAGDRRRRITSVPISTQSHRSGGLIVTQPATLGAILLASIGAAAIIALLILAMSRSSATVAAAASPGSDLPARCTTASVRFPGAADPRGAVVTAYRQNGVDVEATRPGGARLTPESAEQVIGGWIGASLLLEHAGMPAPTLASWLSQETGQPTLANALVSGRSIDGILTADEWADAQSWPASTCEGAFLHDPRNATLVQLVAGVVVR